MKNDKLFMLLLGGTLTLQGIINIFIDDNWSVYRERGALTVPSTFAFVLGVFILLFYAWDWLKTRKHSAKRNVPL